MKNYKVSIMSLILFGNVGKDVLLLIEELFYLSDLGLDTSPRNL